MIEFRKEVNQWSATNCRIDIARKFDLFTIFLQLLKNLESSLLRSKMPFYGHEICFHEFFLQKREFSLQFLFRRNIWRVHMENKKIRTYYIRIINILSSIFYSFPAAASSLAVWSAIASASMICPRFPAMMPGRLEKFALIRWSVTRSCGKL